MSWFDFFLGVLFLAVVPLLMAAYGGHVAAEAITEKAHRRTVKLMFWGIGVLGVLVAIAYQYRTMRADEVREQNNEKWQSSVRYWQKGVDAKLDKVIGHPASEEQRRNALQLKQEVAHLPRYVDAEQLGKKLTEFEGVSASIWSDGTVESGTLAKQIEIGLKMARWGVGGDNTKIADPAWFPDGLTIEISSRAEPSQEQSYKAAAALKKVLKRDFHIESQIRYTDQDFPANFVRIKVASQ